MTAARRAEGGRVTSPLGGGGSGTASIILPSFCSSSSSGQSAAVESPLKADLPRGSFKMLQGRTRSAVETGCVSIAFGLKWQSQLFYNEYNMRELRIVGNRDLH